MGPQMPWNWKMQTMRQQVEWVKKKKKQVEKARILKSKISIKAKGWW